MCTKTVKTLQCFTNKSILHNSGVWFDKKNLKEIKNYSTKILFKWQVFQLWHFYILSTFKNNDYFDVTDCFFFSKSCNQENFK